MRKGVRKIKAQVKRLAAGVLVWMVGICAPGVINDGSYVLAAEYADGDAADDGVAVGGSVAPAGGVAALSVADPASFDQETSSIGTWRDTLPAGEGGITAQAVRGVQVTRGGATVFAVSYEDRAWKNSFDCWAISEPYHSWAYADTEALYAYFEALASLELTAAEETDGMDTVVGAEDGAADSMGEASGVAIDDMPAFEDGAETSIYIAYFSGQGAGAGQAEPDAGITYTFGPEDGAGHYYVRTSRGDGLWLADCGAVDALLGIDPYDCILKVANVVGVLTVSSVDIETAGERVTVEFGDECRIGGAAVEQEEAYALYAELISVFIEEELPREILGGAGDEPTQDVPDEVQGELSQETSGGAGEDQPQDVPGGTWEKLLELTYHRNLEGAPEITETFYAYDEEHALLELNGYAFFLVDRAAVEELIEKI